MKLTSCNTRNSPVYNYNAEQWNSSSDIYLYTVA